jgi:hypothetical protein
VDGEGRVHPQKTVKNIQSLSVMTQKTTTKENFFSQDEKVTKYKNQKKKHIR